MDSSTTDSDTIAATGPGQAHAAGARGAAGLALAAIGIVYGDIGTSPLYTLKTVFDRSGGLPLDEMNLLGVVSLIFWSLTVVVSLKYVTLIMRAHNHGEGGIMALLALASAAVGDRRRLRNVLLAAGVCGAALFYGDGVITPAISVLSAVEGLEIATPRLKPFIVPLTLAVLVVLFMAQKRGSARIGVVFGPVMVLWFVTIAAVGALNIAAAPHILRALDPMAGVRFCLHHGWLAYVALGSVVLALTGAEALYADMGHFGARPIRLAWFSLVFPALALNYLGQGALLLADPAAVENPFYRLFPQWALYPMVILSTVATVIASQAVISGTYSMTKQAIQLGYLPRMRIVNTSPRQAGQIFVPYINSMLLAVVLAAVLGFGSSSALGAAYGIAVTGTMLITTALTFFVIRYAWHYPLALCVAATGFFVLIDAAFFSANLLKIVDGGWFPLTIGAVLFTVMATWKQGRQMLAAQSGGTPLESFLAALLVHPLTRVEGTAIFLSGDPNRVPRAMLHNLAHNKVLHEHVAFVTVLNLQIPRAPEAGRVTVEPLGGGCWRVIVRFGFMDEVDLPGALAACGTLGFPMEPLATSYFLSRENVFPETGRGMALWRKKLFATISRNVRNVPEYFELPAQRVIELGARMQM